MSTFYAAASFDNNGSFPHSPQFKPTESPLNHILELSLPECQISNDSSEKINDEECNVNEQENRQPKRKLTIYEYLDSKRSNSF